MSAQSRTYTQAHFTQAHSTHEHLLLQLGRSVALSPKHGLAQTKFTASFETCRPYLTLLRLGRVGQTIVVLQ